jgi:hypothetical protein
MSDQNKNEAATVEEIKAPEAAAPEAAAEAEAPAEKDAA